MNKRLSGPAFLYAFAVLLWLITFYSMHYTFHVYYQQLHAAKI